ncbi:MAG: ABC transporter substrate-binding protein [Deltaproteobacteria bacterium]|nr:ABC transporter substrate-binding protein [Deltaproteobacteria bacterium]
MKKCSVLSIVLIVAAIMIPSALVEAKDVIKFGVSQPLSSGDYKSGKLNVQTAEMFIDEMNAKGGLLGKKLELVKVDDEGKPAAGVTAMQRLVGAGVSAVVGVWHSSVVMAQAKVVNEAKVPMILHYSWADKLTADHSPYIYRISPFNSEIAQLLVPYLKKNFKTVALMYETTDFGIGFADAVKKYAEPEGIKLYLTGVPAEATDLKPQLLEFKAKDPYPELLILAVNYQPTNLAPKQAAEIGLYPKCGVLCAWDWPCYPDFWEVVGKAGVGVTFATFESKKLKLSPLGEHFKAEFVKRYNFQPPVFLFFMWDGMTMIAETIKRINSAEPDKIAEALIDTKILGTTGEVKFERKGGPVWNQWMGHQLFVKKLTEFKQSGDDAEVVYP